MKNSILLVVLFFLMVSCQYDPYADRYLTEKPEEKELVGTYEFTAQTVDFNLDSLKHKNSYSVIIINSDMTYELKEIPYFKDMGVMDYKYNSDISDKGKWSIETVGSIDNGSGDTKSHWGIILESAPEELRYAGLTGKEKADGIIFGYGDPDVGAVMIYKKK